MFPVPDHAGLIEKMEKRNAQAEELERIVEGLMEDAGLGARKASGRSDDIWRAMMADADLGMDMAELEAKFLAGEREAKKRDRKAAGKE